MKRISLRTALESEEPLTLATEVYNDNNLILKRGTPVTKTVVASLYKLGILTLLVYEGNEADENEETVETGEVAAAPLTEEQIQTLINTPVTYIPCDTDKIELVKYISNSKHQELYKQGIIALQHADVDGVLNVSKKLSDQIRKSPSILSELEDLQQGCDTVISHSMNVATMAIAVGLGLGMKPHEIELLGAAGMLHDVGKLYIDRKILDKPAKLTDEEYAAVKNHAKIGERKLAQNEELDRKIRLVAMQHHENNDGSGYPNGLKRDDIILESRIIHVCDVYEAMIAKRVYKEGILPGLAMEFIMSKCGTMFDKEVLDVFVHTVPAYKTGDKITLSSGENAIVIHGTQKNSLRPVIKIDGSNLLVDMYTDMTFLNRTITGTSESVSYEASMRT